jgi:Zn-finger nucleic acid-binding protein
MNQENNSNPWICDLCQVPIKLAKVKVKYLDGNFEVELMQCPLCHQVFIDEALALGKMVEVEKGLEDK